MSRALIRIENLRRLPQAERQVAQRADEKPVQEIQDEDDHHGGQVEPHRERGQAVPHRTQDRLRDAIEEAHDRVVWIRVDPRDDRPRDDDPDVGVDDELEKAREREDEVAGDEHQAGPRPSSRERSVARSTASMKVVRMPPSSSAAIPAVDVPPGDVTMSLSAPGCRPVSSRSFAAPRTVWVVTVIAVIRSSHMRAPQLAGAWI